MKYKCLIRPIYIIVFAAFILLFSGCISGPTNTTVTNVSINNISATPTPENNISATPAKSGTIKCELCHTNPQNLTPHVNGGKYCINCHGSQVHNIHIGEGTINLDCTTCHGFPPKIPTVQKGEGPGHYIVCENCHAPPPDNLQPSYGNLVVIHLSRGKYCTNCHGTDVGIIHAAAIANMTNTTTNRNITNNTNIKQI